MVNSFLIDDVPPFPKEAPLEKLLVRHDASEGDYFPSSGDLNVNAGSADPTREKLYSRMGDIVGKPFKFVSSDGLFRFKVCYPGTHTICTVILFS